MAAARRGLADGFRLGDGPRLGAPGRRRGTAHRVVAPLLIARRLTARLLVAAGLLGALAGAAQAEIPLQSPLPDATWPDLAGKPVTLAGLKGRPVLVNVWATWCPPCMRELPTLIALDKAHRAAGLQVVGIAIDLDLGLVEAAVEKHHIPYRVLHDAHGTASRPFRLEQVPATFLYDAEGRLVWQTADELRADDAGFKAALAQVLGAAAAP